MITEPLPPIEGHSKYSPFLQRLAIKFMLAIITDHGMLNAENPLKYEAKWIDLIAPKAYKFISYNPRHNNDNDIDFICTGEHSEVEEKFKGLVGYEELSEVLDQFLEEY